MRRGDLAHHSVAQVLRQAAAEELSGGIDFHTATPGCVHLVDGQVYLATGAERPVTIDLDLDSDGRALQAEERRIRDHSIDVLSDLLPATDGWYFFHPLNHHAARGWWQWDTEQLVAEARHRSGVGAPAADPVDAATGEVTLRATPPSRPPGPDAWSVIVALAQPTAPDELARRLGWPADRLSEVVAEMAAVGLIRADDETSPAAAGSDLDQDAAAAPPPDTETVQEQDQDATAAGSQRSALRRLIDSLRAAS